MTQPRKATVGDLKQEILARLNFEAFYSKFIRSGESLKIASSDGWSNRVFCPIHQDVSEPNFFCNLENGSYKCQACGSGGSVFDFWLVMNNYSPQDKRTFRHALTALATEAGIDIASFSASFKPSDLPPGATAKTDKAVSATSIPKLNKADANDKTKSPIALDVVHEMQKALRRDHFVYLNQKRGLSKKTIDEWMIGFDDHALTKHKETGEWVRGRYSIPVLNKDEQVRNIRLYSPLADPAYKMINYVRDKDTVREERFGQPVRLLGLHRLLKLKPVNIVICEGEWDCLLLNQMLEEAGYKTWTAVTGTHGANTFEPEWLEYFQGAHVFFVYDCDEAGKSAALDHVNKHFIKCLPLFTSVRIVELPLDGSKEMKDVSDYFLKAERTCEDFIRLCTSTPEVIVGGVANDEGTQEAVSVPDFITAIKDRQYIDKRVTVPITISGTTSKVYHAIRSYSVTRCPLMDKDAEACCSSMNTERTVAYGHQLFIEACMEKEVNVLRSLARIACQKDEKCTVSPVAKVVMEEYFAHQVVARWRAQEDDEGRMRNAQELVQTSVYILQPPQNINIEPQNYMATGYIRTHPRTSIATFFIEQMVPMEEDWKKFTVESPENRAMLKTLQKEFDVAQIISDLTNGVTRIYEMDEILITVLLTYLSPLWIQFNGNLQRGWINAAIIGDSGTGKSKTYERFSDWVELGDLFSALSGTRTGLLYAIKKRSDEWHVSIGRYVQASCKIISIDETQEADRSEIKRMAVAMDTGYLKVDQVASGGYHTQTRALFLMNPKDIYGNAATISDFTFGCDALRMCFDPMFIRRLDMAVFTTGNQKHEFYNRLNPSTREGHQMRLTSRMMRTLIYWAWTRRADQIIWTEEATKYCLDIATQLSREFGDADNVPLVNPQDFREKLARLATAYSILDRNFSEDLECVKVEVPHVEFIANLVDRIYSTPSCNLRQKSKAARSRNALDDFEKIQDAFEAAIRQSRSSSNESFRQGDFFVRFLAFLQSMGNFRKRDLAEQLNVNMAWVTKRIMILQGYNLVDIAKHGGYRTTRKFNLFMQRWLQKPEIEQMFQEVQERIGKQALQQADSLEPYQPQVSNTSGYYDNDPFAE